MSIKEKLQGVFPALLTPFDENNRINEKALAELIDMNIKKGVSGFYVGGSTAEVFLISDDERRYLYKTTAEIVDGRCTLIAHIGGISTEKSIGFAKYVCHLGKYSAISSITPFYYNFSFDEIKRYYFDVVNEGDLPMIIYNFPSFSGVSLSADNICEFYEDDRFIGLKHTSNDYFTMERIKKAYPDRIMYNGYDEMFIAGLSMGADGGIGSTYNFMAEKFIEIRRLFIAGKIKEAQKIQNDANAIVSELCKVGVMPGEKAILNYMGLDFGKCRKPFAEITQEQYKNLINAVEPLL